MARKILIAVGALALIAGTQASAFEPLPDGTTSEERASTARLNAEQRARAEAEDAAYQQQLDAVARQNAAAQADFAEKTAAYEAEKARVAATAAKERMQWEADVAACKAGDVTHCGPPTTAPQL